MLRWLSTISLLMAGRSGLSCRREGFISQWMHSTYMCILFFRYGHKCGRIEDMVVIVGGANERGDYVSSTMLLNIVTRQVWAPSIGNYWDQKTNSNYFQDFTNDWIRLQKEATWHCHGLSMEWLLLGNNFSSLGALTRPTIVSQRWDFFRLQEMMCKGGDLESRVRDMGACWYGVGNWQSWVWNSHSPFWFNHMQQC